MEKRSKELLKMLERQFLKDDFNDGAMGKPFNQKENRKYTEELLNLNLIERRNCILEMYQLPKQRRKVLKMKELINVIRENEEGKKKLSFKDFKKDLMFQIKEDINTQEMYEEYLMDDVENPLSFNEYTNEVFNMKIDEIKNGYSIEILGDTYYKSMI